LPRARRHVRAQRIRGDQALKEAGRASAPTARTCSNLPTGEIYPRAAITTGTAQPPRPRTSNVRNSRPAPIRGCRFGSTTAVGEAGGLFMQENHPVDRLVVALEGEVTASIVRAMQISKERLAGRRTWVLGPPVLLDQSDEHGSRWVGFGLLLYTALPPWGEDRLSSRQGSPGRSQRVGRRGMPNFGSV
jgi:hypothetical protein